MGTANSDWRGDERLIAVAEALRRTCGHPPREARHWQAMWDQWGTEGDRWIRQARAAIAAYTHEHRYPRPNGQGFPVDQCLDCLEWRSDGDSKAEP